jgi:hypothetical protein
LGADVFGSGGAPTLGAEVEDMADVAVAEAFAGGAWFFLEDDLDLASVGLGGFSDELLDRAGRFATDVIGAVAAHFA